MYAGQLEWGRWATRLVLAGAIACALVSILVSAAFAAVVSSNINVSMTIQGECKIQATTNLAFGTDGVIDANVDASSTFDVQCTNTTPYTVALNAGAGAGATTTIRKMTLTGATIDYGLYRDAARSQNWGNTVATDTAAGTGTGAVQQSTIYGRVPPQTTPAPGLYQDTIQISVTY